MPQGEAKIRTLAESIITDEAHPDGRFTYIENWFGASSFFGTERYHGPYRDVYFITRDRFMDSTIYAASKITPAGIITLQDLHGNGVCDSFEEARDRIRENYKA